MSAHRFTPSHIRQHMDAVSLHQSKVAAALREPAKLLPYLMDHIATGDKELTLARICVTAQTDEAEAGRMLKLFAADAAHEGARWSLGDDAEVVEPLSTLELMTMAARGIVPVKGGAK